MWWVQARANEVDRVRGTPSNRIPCIRDFRVFHQSARTVSVNQVSKDAQLGSPLQQLQIGIRALPHR
jgi:hypothetical protein